MMIKQFNSERLRQLRQKRGLSLVGLSKELYKRVSLDRSPETLRKWESGETFPAADEVTLIAQFYKRQPSFLFTNKLN